MFARVPDSMWSMRCEIGWPMVTLVPGSSDTFRADLLEHHLPGRASDGVEPHVDLGGLDALHVLVQLGPSRPAGGGRHFGHAQQQPLERVAQRVRVRQARCPEW